MDDGYPLMGDASEDEGMDAVAEAEELRLDRALVPRKIIGELIKSLFFAIAACT